MTSSQQNQSHPPPRNIRPSRQQGLLPCWFDDSPEILSLLLVAPCRKTKCILPVLRLNHPRSCSAANRQCELQPRHPHSRPRYVHIPCFGKSASPCYTPLPNCIGAGACCDVDLFLSLSKLLQDRLLSLFLPKHAIRLLILIRPVNPSRCSVPIVFQNSSQDELACPLRKSISLIPFLATLSVCNRTSN